MRERAFREADEVVVSRFEAGVGQPLGLVHRLQSSLVNRQSPGLVTRFVGVDFPRS